MKVKVLQNILSANDQIAANNQRLLNDNGILAVNVMSSPGARKDQPDTPNDKEIKE